MWLVCFSSFSLLELLWWNSKVSLNPSLSLSLQETVALPLFPFEDSPRLRIEEVDWRPQVLLSTTSQRSCTSFLFCVSCSYRKRFVSFLAVLMEEPVRGVYTWPWVQMCWGHWDKQVCPSCFNASLSEKTSFTLKRLLAHKNETEHNLNCENVFFHFRFVVK